MEIGGLFINVAQENYPLWPLKKDFYMAIKARMSIPVYVVRHTSDCKLFAVSQIMPDGQETKQVIYNENEYKQFIESR